MTTPTTKKQEKMVISPRSLRSGRQSRSRIRFIGTSLPVMLAYASAPGYHPDIDEIKVPETAQLCPALNRDVESTTQLYGAGHAGGSRCLIGGANGVADVVSSSNLGAKKIKQVLCLPVNAA